MYEKFWAIDLEGTTVKCRGRNETSKLDKMGMKSADNC